MASITIEASKVSRKIQNLVESRILGKVSGVESSFECRKVGLQV